MKVSCVVKPPVEPIDACAVRCEMIRAAAITADAQIIFSFPVLGVGKSVPGGAGCEGDWPGTDARRGCLAGREDPGIPIAAAVESTGAEPTHPPSDQESYA